MGDQPFMDDETDDDDNVFYEEDPVEAFRLLAEAHEWTVSEDVEGGEKETSCHFVATDDSITLPVTVQWLPDEEILMVAIAYELECEPANLLYFLAMLNEVNEKIVIGTLVYQVEFSLLIWKTGMTLCNTVGITHDQVATLVESGMYVFKSHIKDLCDPNGVTLEKNKLMLAASVNRGRLN